MALKQEGKDRNGFGSLIIDKRNTHIASGGMQGILQGSVKNGPFGIMLFCHSRIM
jgi:hypothetical protein